MKGDTGATYYRLDETDHIQDIAPRIYAFVEYRPSSRTTATLGTDNVTNAVSMRSRTFHDPDRATIDPLLQEYRERNPQVLFYPSIKHSFG